MAKKKSPPKKSTSQIKKLNFLIGKWHTAGEFLNNISDSSKEIRGMDIYEWVSGEAFILHRVDVFMGNTRTEVIEIIGYDEGRKLYFMKSFDNLGEATTMYAELVKPGVLKIWDSKMKSTLTVNKNGNSMVVKWELSEDGRTWKPWMEIKLSK